MQSDTPYQEHTWITAKESVLNLVNRATWGDIFYSHQRNIDKIEMFINEDLQKYFKNTK